MIKTEEPSGVNPVAESEATGIIRDLYTDIRELLGIGLVPLVFRQLAAIPGSLPWCWEVIRPLYASGAAFEAGRELLVRIPEPKPRPLPRAVFDSLGLGSQSLETIRRILDHFNHSNPANLVALSALRRLIASPPDSAGSGIGAADGFGAIPARRTDAVPPVRLPPLPSMLDIDTLDDRTVDLIHQIQQIGLPVGKEGAATIDLTQRREMASIWRILARWPSYLALVLVILRAWEDSGRLSQAKEAVQKETERLALELSHQYIRPRESGRPDPAAMKATADVLWRFTGIRLIRTLPVVGLLQATLP